MQGALKNYVRTRDYCTMPQHVITMCLAVIRCGLEAANHVHVANYVAKAEQTPDIGKDAVTVSKLRSASGISALDAKKYKTAAKKFTEVRPLRFVPMSGMQNVFALPCLKLMVIHHASAYAMCCLCL